MKNKAVVYAIPILVALALAVGVTALAQSPRQIRLHGTISDYTTATAPVNGPWDVRGTWSLIIKESGKADFSAALDMVHSDQGVIQSGANDFETGAGRNAHTHHVTLTDGNLTPIPGGFRVTGGKATITLNGTAPPPFGTDYGLQIDVTGGNTVTPSNIAVSFLDKAANHFGPLPLHGVVRDSNNDYPDKH